MYREKRKACKSLIVMQIDIQEINYIRDREN
jgi:hypothetical protein